MLVPASACFAVALGSAIITGDLQGPADRFHVGLEVSNLAVTLVSRLLFCHARRLF
jgi:hypothetical protein